MVGKRKRYSAEFKAKVAIEALRGELTTSQLASKHGVHQTMVGEWKRQAVEGLVAVFSGKGEAKEGIREEEVEKLHAKIGQLVMERDLPAGISLECAPNQYLRKIRHGTTGRLKYGSLPPCLLSRTFAEPQTLELRVFSNVTDHRRKSLARDETGDSGSLTSHRRAQLPPLSGA